MLSLSLHVAAVCEEITDYITPLPHFAAIAACHCSCRHYHYVSLFTLRLRYFSRHYDAAAITLLLIFSSLLLPPMIEYFELR